jgi:hypothetical protein
MCRTGEHKDDDGAKCARMAFEHGAVPQMDAESPVREPGQLAMFM